MRIRKRSKPELHESSSNGSLHLHATSKSNPSSQDPRSSLISPAPGITKQDHFLLAGSGYGATHIRPSQKQLPIEAVPLKGKYCAVVSSGAESRQDEKGLMIKKGEGNPRAKSVTDMPHTNEVQQSHLHIGGDDNVKGMYMKGCKELGLLISSGEGDKLADACKIKGRHNTVCKGSALHGEISRHTDPATVDVSDGPRKVRPLQLILSSDYSSTATNLPLSLCPTRSGSTMPGTPPPLPRKFDNASPSALMKRRPFTSPAGGSIIKQIADVKPLDEMRLIRNEDASSCSRNTIDQSLASHVENRAEFESCRHISSWQGHRRPRSHVKGRCGPPGVDAPGVNPVITKESTERTRKKAKRKPLDILVSAPSVSVQALPTTSPPTPAGNGELRKQDFPAATNIIGYLAAAEVNCAANTVTHTYDNHVPPVLPAASSDHELQLDSMRCRRKDGRRWRCKAQVVKAGAPFCHYHTLKMREKHAASVIRKLSKQLQGEVKISIGHTGFSRSSNIKRANKRRRILSSPSKKSVQDAYDGGCKVAGIVEEYVDDEEELGHEEELEEEKNKKEDEQQKIMLAGKLQLQERATSTRRWRKKCKPCIRRLNDIRDRARPAAMDGLDIFNSCGEDMLNLNKDSPPVSPLPLCFLNSDPHEWRSDFP